ncbi:hypothetical protein Naga_102379g1 [Nannochloropsis gaditana]|uniref:Uncharacterized protein n=1 Tax=Nannochloropsis gaditana TaxID=72520 RepID=W7THP8_9STRA|nr:hypothetical protein Naga_102379g1 [Nannochloropsis gaditana]
MYSCHKISRNGAGSRRDKEGGRGGGRERGRGGGREGGRGGGRERGRGGGQEGGRGGGGGAIDIPAHGRGRGGDLFQTGGEGGREGGKEGGREGGREGERGGREGGREGGPREGRAMGDEGSTARRGVNVSGTGGGRMVASCLIVAFTL